MTPQEDARVLLALVDRHLQALRLNLDPAYPDEEWGFTAQQSVEKLLKARIVLDDQRPPFTHMLQELALLAGLELDPALLSLQPYEVEARYEEGPFPLCDDRSLILEQIMFLRSDVVKEACGPHQS
ncbi:HEPN domain-containing protein [Synechococcus sp. CBW1108]|uniref:HEPN domain-containing protein n=1 Tax=Synechococcus sp. CBW1108 TaxID=1353147 RepID=UPI0018CDC931|nr:HEPN domain-containing protein [Synechococcus sp. CBW1108]QPN70432.1 HEPN domain-containing protein [Synechococcus sp. CBW1108]